MPNENEMKLASLIQREIRRLPPIEAPVSLLPRVMAAVEARARQPWWKRSWVSWPWSCRVAFLVMSLVLAVGCVFGLGLLGQAGSSQSLRESLSGGVSFLRPVWEIGGALGNALVLVFRSGGPTLVWTTCLTLGAIYLTSVGLGTLCYRVAANKL